MASIALYARVSTLNQATGLEAQVRALKAWAAANSCADFRVYTDEVSGRRASRPGLDSLMADAKNGTVSTVVVYSLSRFSRSVRHLLENLEVLTEHGVAFVSLTEQLNSGTATGRAILSIIGAIAELEADLIRERVKTGLVNAKAKGKKLGRPSLVDRNLVEALVAQGMTYRQIAALTKASHYTIRQVVAARTESTQTEQRRAL